MSYEMAMMMNWLLVAAGLLTTDLFSDWFDTFFDDDDEDEPDPVINSITLTTDDDTTAGTDAHDRILGLAGQDSLAGGAGNDSIEGNIGDDTLRGEAGDDVLAGGGDTDTIYGGDGDDLLSSDRVDSRADFSRGGAETLDGGAGDDRLYFSGEDQVTGGVGADSFGLIDSGEPPALITDFEVGVDDVVIYVDGLTGAATPPDVTYDVDTIANTTTVSIDGAAVLAFSGIYTEAELAVTLADVDMLDFPEAAAVT